VALSFAIALLIVQRLAGSSDSQTKSIHPVYGVLNSIMELVKQFLGFVSVQIWTVVNTALTFVLQLPIVGPILETFFDILAVPVRAIVLFFEMPWTDPNWDPAACEAASCRKLEEEVEDITRQLDRTEERLKGH